MHKAAVLLYFLLIAYSAKCQLSQEDFSRFEAMIDKEWQSEVNELTITWTMNAIQNGNAFRKELKIPATGFTSETIFYWDILNHQISFLRITNQGFVLSGKATVDRNLITLSGIQAKDFDCCQTDGQRTDRFRC